MSADGAFEPLPFDVDLGPELEAAMAEQRAEVDAIADGPWPPAFEDTIAALERSGRSTSGIALRAVGTNNRSTFFPHVFSGHYAGTHYSYLWSAMLEAAARQWMDEEGGLTRTAGRRLRDELLSRGAVVDPLAALRAITGREPSVGPMLEQRGLA